MSAVGRRAVNIFLICTGLLLVGPSDADASIDLGSFRGRVLYLDLLIGFDKLASCRATPFLINFGGDLRANRPPLHGVWQIGIERPDTERDAAILLELEHGAPEYPTRHARSRWLPAVARRPD
jgi:hypothetical protein